MKKFYYMLLVTSLLLLLTACGNTANKETKDAEKNAPEVTDEPIDTGEPADDDDPEDTAEPSDEEETEEPTLSVILSYDEAHHTITVNDVKLGDTEENVQEILGEPINIDYDEAFAIHTYHFFEAWFSETLTLIYEQEVLVEIVTSTSKDGNLITKDFIKKFPGDIYMATSAVTNYEGVKERFALVLTEDVVIIADRKKVDGETRNYFYITSAYNFGMNESTSLEYFTNKDYFIPVSKDLLLNY
jgi:predicted small lipoprotein YifL